MHSKKCIHLVLFLRGRGSIKKTGNRGVSKDPVSWLKGHAGGRSIPFRRREDMRGVEGSRVVVEGTCEGSMSPACYPSLAPAPPPFGRTVFCRSHKTEGVARPISRASRDLELSRTPQMSPIRQFAFQTRKELFRRESPIFRQTRSTCGAPRF